MGDLTISDTTLALTDPELSVLNQLVASGDRAGFYMAYYAMTGSQEAALQAKISTFSDNVGGYAFVANRLEQILFGQGGFNQFFDYPGIYFLSQQIAQGALATITNSVAQGGTGQVQDQDIFTAAKQAWVKNGLGDLFPGNLIEGGVTGDFSSLFSIGTAASLVASLFAGPLGKQLSDFPGAR